MHEVLDLYEIFFRYQLFAADLGRVCLEMGSTDVPSIAMATSIGKWWINQWLGYPIFRSSGWQGTLHLLIGADVVEEMLGETCRVATKGRGETGDFEECGRGSHPFDLREVNISMEKMNNAHVWIIYLLKMVIFRSGITNGGGSLFFLRDRKRKTERYDFQRHAVYR